MNDKINDKKQEIIDLKKMNDRDGWNQASSWIVVFTGFGYTIVIIWALIVFAYDLEQTNGLILFIIQMFGLVFYIFIIIHWFVFGRKNLINRVNERKKLINQLEKEINEELHD